MPRLGAAGSEGRNSGASCASECVLLHAPNSAYTQFALPGEGTATVDDTYLGPEARARRRIDEMSAAAGWAVRVQSGANRGAGAGDGTIISWSEVPKVEMGSG